MFRQVASIGCILAATLVAGSASAATVTFTNAYTSVGASALPASDSIDVSTFFSERKADGQDILLNSASFTLRGTTAERGATSTHYQGSYSYSVPYTYSVPYSYSCGSVFSPRTCTGYRTETGYETRYAPVYNVYNGDSVADVAHVFVGGTSLSISSASPTTYTGSAGYNGSTRYNYYASSSYGSFSNSTSLMSGVLSSLAINGSLPFILDVTHGIYDSLFVDLTLDYTATDKPIEVAPVPLPASATFLLAGMGGLTVLRRRKKLA